MVRREISHLTGGSNLGAISRGASSLGASIEQMSRGQSRGGSLAGVTGSPLSRSSPCSRSRLSLPKASFTSLNDEHAEERHADGHADGHAHEHADADGRRVEAQWFSRRRSCSMGRASWGRASWGRERIAPEGVAMPRSRRGSSALSRFGSRHSFGPRLPRVSSFAEDQIALVLCPGSMTPKAPPGIAPPADGPTDVANIAAHRHPPGRSPSPVVSL